MKIINGERHPTVTYDEILGFFGEYRFMSNFHIGLLEVDGIYYPSAEHAYMAQKTLDLELRKKIALLDPDSPGRIKRFGQTITLRDNWDHLRIGAMLMVLTAKFSDPELARKLLATGNRRLEETNNWKDRYWGVDGHGQNFLGELLMLVRKNLRLQQPKPQEELF